MFENWNVNSSQRDENWNSWEINPTEFPSESG